MRKSLAAFGDGRFRFQGQVKRGFSLAVEATATLGSTVS